MGSVGTPEILLILVIALLLFGPQKLPELGKSLGRAIREFKKASSELQETIEREVEEVNRTAREEPKGLPTNTPGLPAGAMPPPSAPLPPPPPPEKTEAAAPPPPVEPS
jgi:TatA/E family protein of Tat protein translocase